ncbi:hypothetical protein ABE096_22140 [Robertmurraya massiliosenegalensis]
MKLGAKKIINGNAKHLLTEMKVDNLSAAKKNFMKEAISIAKKHR